MNKHLFFVLFLFIATSGYSQTSSGTMMLGGTVEFSSRSYQSGSSSDAAGFTFAPSFGYFIVDNLAVGAVITLESSRLGTGAAKSVNSSFGFGPFVRYYKFTSNEKFAFFGNADLSFSSGKYDPPSGNVIRGNGIRFAVSPGATYFLNEHWAMELSFSLFSISSTDPNTESDDDKFTSVSFGVDSFSPGLGIRYHF